MKSMIVLATGLGLVLSAEDVKAAVQPSFHLESCAWGASHVIVATEGDKIDGDVEVLESWKGDLKRGDRITIPELAAFTPEKQRVISKRLFREDEDKNLPKSVTCARMVLFLVRKEEPTKTNWLPAAGEWGGMMVSTAWVEADKVFAFAQEINPGPSRLFYWGMNECGLKCQVDDVVKAQTALSEAIRQNDAAKLTTVIPSFLRSEYEIVRIAAIISLGEAGSKGLPSLRAILKDMTMLKYHDLAIRALTKAGGKAIGTDLTEILKEERAFWAKTGPELKEGWWSGAGIEWDKVEHLRNHYIRALRAIDELGEMGHAV